MRPDWKLVQPTDPLYDAGHPVKYKVDAYGYTDFRAAPDGDLPTQMPDDEDANSPYGWTVTREPDTRPTGTDQVWIVATKS
jgi:hypothetical protein